MSEAEQISATPDKPYPALEKTLLEALSILSLVFKPFGVGGAISVATWELRII